MQDGCWAPPAIPYASCWKCFENYWCFPLNCLLEQPNTIMASQMDRGSSVLEGFHLWVRGGLLGQTFPLSLQWSQGLLILTCCDQTLGAAGSQHQLHRSAKFFSALWMGCLGWAAGPRMLLHQDSGNIFTWLMASSVYSPWAVMWITKNCHCSTDKNLILHFVYLWF